MQNLTANQKKILEFIEKSEEKNGFPPTYETIAKYFGYATKSSVQHYIEVLTKKGYLTKERHLSHSLRVHKDGNLIPLLGKVAAGRPIENKKYNERIEVPLNMMKAAGEYFALQVSGDSMIGEGILDGDYVVIRSQNTATNGEIVVAELDEEATIKRFYKKRDHVELHSANPQYKPILVGENKQLKIAGIYCGLLRY
jgi:repressor LexA